MSRQTRCSICYLIKYPPLHLCSFHLRTHFSSPFTAKLLERVHNHCLCFFAFQYLLIPLQPGLSLHHCTATAFFFFFATAFIKVITDVSILQNPMVNWLSSSYLISSSIWHSAILSPWDTFYTWLLGHHNLLVFLLSHWLLMINKCFLNKWIFNMIRHLILKHRCVENRYKQGKWREM